MEESLKNQKKIPAVIHMYLNTFKYIFRNILYVLLICFICFTLGQLSTAGYLKCLFMLAEAVNQKGYIAANNLLEYVKSPLVIVIALLYIITLCNLLFFQIGIFIYIFEKSEDKDKVRIGEMLNFGFRAVKKLAHPKNWIIYLYVLLILPFTDFIHFTYFQVSVVVPGFIVDYITSNMALAILYGIVTAALLVLSVLSIFAFHYFLLEDISFFKACLKSIRTFWHHKLSSILLALMVFVSVFVALIIAVYPVISVMEAISTDDNLAIFSSWMYLVNFLSVVVVFISLPIIFAAITSMFHYYKQDELEKFTFDYKITSKRSLIIRNITLSIFILGFSVSDVLLNLDNYAVYNTVSEEPIAIAHRGNSVEAPENSIPAYELAVSQGADMIELDIHETKDKVLIISHDANLKRISGKNINVYDVTYDEIKDLDVGSWFSEDFSYLRIATLEEVFVQFKDRVQLLVEIKPTDYDDGLEEELIKLIYKYDMKDQVTIHSLNTEPLLRVKELDPTIKVGYCMFIAMGKIENLTWSDFYTVEESNVNAELVRKAHEAGKKIYVWTINDSNNIQYLTDCGVDGFIGDDPSMLKENISTSIYDSGFSKFMRLFAYQKIVM